MGNHIRQRALAFMASRHSITLATVGIDGLLISPASYVLCDEFDFWFIADTNEGFDTVTAAAGIVRSDATCPEDVEARIEGSIEPVHDFVEQAKAFSAFLLHAVDLTAFKQKYEGGQPLVVYRMKARRIHFRSPSLLRHTAVFHIAPPLRDTSSTRSRRRKLKPIRSKAAPVLPMDRPTLSDRTAAVPKPSIVPPS